MVYEERIMILMNGHIGSGTGHKEGSFLAWHFNNLDFDEESRFMDELFRTPILAIDITGEDLSRVNAEPIQVRFHYPYSLGAGCSLLPAPLYFLSITYRQAPYATLGKWSHVPGDSRLLCLRL